MRAKIKRCLQHWFNPLHIMCRIRDLHNLLGKDYDFRANRKWLLKYEHFYKMAGLS